MRTGCHLSAKTYMAALPDTYCRYSVYDHEYKTKDGRTTSKLLFVAWCVPVANGCVSTPGMIDWSPISLTQ
jgi:hypothetical protein